MNWNGVTSSSESTEKWKKIVHAREEKIRAFLQYAPELGCPDSALIGPLAGVPFGVKDNIAVRRFQLSCGSRILGSFTSPYTATSVAKLQAAGAVVAGKTNLDEFGMGSSTENSAFQTTANPWDLSRVPGGSSGGSAAAVACGSVAFALGSDTGGSIRQPAAFCGIYGLKPTYGSVSRYGLVAYASSLDVIGVAAKKVEVIEQVFTVMRGKDPLDQSSLSYLPAEPRKKAGKAGAFSIGVPREISGVPMHADVKKTLEVTKAAFGKMGCTVTEVSLPTLEYVVSCYYIIATAEASANLARFDGVRYGMRAQQADNPEQMMVRTRNEGFGDEVKLRILLGTYVLRSGFQDEYYIKAQKVRTAIKNDFDGAFRGVDLILMPVYPVPPFQRGSSDADPFSQKLADIFTCSANLAGLPALSFPAAVENGLPIGMQLLAPAFAESRLFEACSAFEKIFPSPDPPGFPMEWR
jgi:aspartyl-tRNA(Asn)/glutamyl-tRNA(Gln) amidotransferase subunit A